MCPPLHPEAAQQHTATTETPRRPGGAGGGERRKLIGVRRPSAHASSVQRRSRNPGPAAGVGTSITMQPKAPLLLGPGPGQRASKRRDGEARRRGAVEEARDDSWGDERERQQPPDVPFEL